MNNLPDKGNSSESNNKLQLKTSYAVKRQWEPFYTGGCVEASSDGHFLLCMCGEKIQIIDLESGSVTKVLKHDDGEISCFKLSPDNEFVVSATRSLLLKQWDWKEMKCNRTWKAIHVAPVTSMDFDSTSTLLATGGSDATIKVWDLVHQYCTHNFKSPPGVVNSVKFHPTNLTLYSSSDDYDIKVWELHTSRCMAILEGHNSAITSIKFASEEVLVTAGRDNIVALWDVPTRPTQTKITPTKVVPIFKTVEDLMILNSKEIPSDCGGRNLSNVLHFMTCGSEGIARIWNSIDGTCVYSNEALNTALTKPGYVHCKLLPKYNQYVFVTDDQQFDFLSVKNLKLERHLVGYNDDILDIKLLGEDESYMVVATNSPNIKVFHISSSSCQVLHGHADTVLCLDVFPNKVSFVSSSKDNSIRLWALVNSDGIIQCLSKIEGHTHAVSCLSACRITNNVFASGSEDCTLKIWSVKKVKKKGIVTTVKCTAIAHQKPLNCVCVSPNDRLVATGAQDKLAKLWDIENGKQVKTFQGHKRGVWCVQFSPIDQVLASSSADGTIKLWSLSDGTCLKTLEGHDSSVLKLVFIVKGTQIITTGSDGLLKLWTVKSNECVQTMDNHSDRVWALCTARNDQTLYTGSADSIIIEWDDVSEKLKIENEQAKENTILQHQELQNLLHEKKYIKALLFAIKLNQPFTALNVVKELLWEDDGMEELENHIGKLREDQKQTLFKFIVSWNSNSRNCHEAQAVLRALFLCTTPQEIQKYPDSQATIEALLPYTDRHFQRLSRIAQQATFLDYTWCVMKMAPMGL